MIPYQIIKEHISLGFLVVYKNNEILSQEDYLKCVLVYRYYIWLDLLTTVEYKSLHCLFQGGGKIEADYNITNSSSTA